MKRIARKTFVICITLAMMLTMIPFVTTTADAVKLDPVNVNGLNFELYDDANDGSGVGRGSVWITSYTGTSSEFVVPTKVKSKDGKVTFTVDSSDFDIMGQAFKDNKTIKKAAIPTGIYNIANSAFEGCTNLVEISIGNLSGYAYGDGLGQNVFRGCTNLKTYNIDSSGLALSNYDALKGQFINARIGTDASGNPIAGVTVYTQKDGVVWKAIEEYNSSRGDKPINLVDCQDPYSRSTVSNSGDNGGGGSQNGVDGTPYGKGASKDAMNKAITKYASESDPKGTVFGLLKAKLYKATNTSLTLQWSKVSGAKKYIVYGSVCGAKNKMVKQLETTKTKLVFKKVNKKKVKKGTYYKFIIVALDGNNKVVSTSKIVHAATTGGKVGNDKAVKTKAKKNKVSIKKGKTFKLAAKAVPKSKKLKVKKHRAIKYESSNTKIATVNSKGVIKGKGKGKCTVYAYAQNGMCAAIKVTVK